MEKTVLNLYCGVGGNRKNWKNVKVTAVELCPKIAAVYAKLYPNDTVIIGDAHQYLLDHFEKFDFIWSSPPCQSHSKMVKATRHTIRKYPDMKLYEEIIFLQNFCKSDWIVENVVPYYPPLVPGTLIDRHLFWSNRSLNTNFSMERPKNFIQRSNLQGKKEMMEWLGIQFDEVIYYQKNHCPVQILRNCVHPLLGEHIFKSFHEI